MKRSTRSKSISCPKTNVATHQTKETLALLQILALGNREIEEGKVVPAAKAILAIRDRIAS